MAFDLDGTLVDSCADLVAAVNHVLRAFSRPPVGAPTLTGWVGHGARVLVARALAPAEPDEVEAGVRCFLDYYARHLLDATRPYPGVPELIDELHGRGVALTVLTNKPEALSRAILDGLGLAVPFAAMVGGDTLPARKPDPGGLRWLCRRTGVAPAATVLVGDSPVDLDTARAAGVRFCGVAWGLQPAALREARPDCLVRSVPELRAELTRGPAPRLDSAGISG